MTGPVLALFHRAVRVESRSKVSYVARVALAAFLLVNLGIAQLMAAWRGAHGLLFFSSVVHVNFFFITVAGLGYFASAITEEKEEATLGLLRMTGLTPLSILFGKSTSRLFGALLLLLAQFPFTLLAESLGGVGVRQIAAAYCTLAAYTFLLSNIALLFSVVSRSTRLAAFLTVVVLILFFSGPSIGSGILSLGRARHWWKAASPGVIAVQSALSGLRDASPGGRLGEILRTGFSASPIGWQVLSNVALGVGFFLLAWACFNRATRSETPAGPARPAFSRRIPMLAPGRAWRRAVVWKDFYFLGGGKVVVLLKITLFSGLFVFISNYGLRHGGAWDEIGMTIFWIAYVALMIELAFSAARIFRQEIQWKTVSGLGALPVSVRRWASQKVAASILSVAPTLAFLAIGFLLAAKDFAKLFQHGDPAAAVLGATLGVCESVLFLLFVVLLSLLLKRGGLPLAILIFYGGNLVCGVMITGIFIQSPTAGLLTMIIGSVICIPMVVTIIFSRLEYILTTD